MARDKIKLPYVALLLFYLVNSCNSDHLSDKYFACYLKCV